MLNIISYLSEEDLEDIVPKDPAVLKFILFCWAAILVGYGIVAARFT